MDMNPQGFSNSNAPELKIAMCNVFTICRNIHIDINIMRTLELDLAAAVSFLNLGT